ncbi:hypothetical protein EMIT053CA3_100088 [Pseudomonas donghuensis]
MCWNARTERRFLVPGKAMPEQAADRLTAIKFAGHGACQVVAGALSVVVEPAVYPGKPWTSQNLAANPSIKRTAMNGHCSNRPGATACRC